MLRPPVILSDGKRAGAGHAVPEFRRGFCRIVRRCDDIGPVLDDVLEEKRADSLPLLRAADKRLEILHDQKVGVSAQRPRRVVERPGRCGAPAAQLRAAGAHDVRVVEPVRELGGELCTVRHAEHQQGTGQRLTRLRAAQQAAPPQCRERLPAERQELLQAVCTGQNAQQKGAGPREHIPEDADAAAVSQVRAHQVFIHMRHVYPAAVQLAEHVQLVVVQADQRRGDQRTDRRRQPAEPGLADARQQPAAAVCRQREKQGITGQLQEAERGRPAGMRADIEQRAITGQQRQKQQRRVQTDQQDQKYGMPCFFHVSSPLSFADSVP